MEEYTIVRQDGSHYDTYEEQFYSDSWECTVDTKEYLETLMANNPQKFENCQIIINL